jgi:GLPGLI family protein
MKFIYIILLIVFTSDFSILKAQDNFKATYRLTYQPDSTNKRSKESELFLLYMNKEMSQFLSHNYALSDSIMLKIQTGNMTTEEIIEQTMSQPTTNFHIKINKLYGEAKMEVLQELMANFYTYVQPLNLMEWEITGESKEVEGYNCQKATTRYAGRNYIAWFDPEIPISDGPYEFNGLPGLIISVYDTREHYRFDLVGLEKGAYRIKRNLLNDDYQTVTQAEYRQMVENYKVNAEAMAKRMFSNMEGSLQRRESSANNPIHLD